MRIIKEGNILNFLMEGLHKRAEDESILTQSMPSQDETLSPTSSGSGTENRGD